MVNTNDLCELDIDKKIYLEKFSLRELQKESSRALSTMQATNNNINQFNKQAHHNSRNWYLAVIKWYVEKYGDLPSLAGPGTDIKLIYDL